MPTKERVAYSGTVKATRKCWAGHPVNALHEPGDVFEIPATVLWDDAPFIPVTVTGYTESGKPIAELKKDVPIYPFLDRPNSYEALRSLPPRPAHEA